MTDEQIKSYIRTQEKMIELGVLIDGTNIAQTKKWRREKIEELKKQLSEEPKKTKNAQTSKKVRRKPKS